MKNPLGAVDFKGAFVEHGEKIALGFVGLIVLLVWGIGTRWSGTDKHPFELEEQVEQAEQAVARSVWPEEDRLALAATMQGPSHPAKVVESFLATVDAGDARFDGLVFDKRRPMVYSIRGDEKLIEEPTWQAMIEPIAGTSVIVLDVPIGVLGGGEDLLVEADPLDAGSEEPAEDDESAPEFNPFIRRNGGGNAQAGRGIAIDPSAAQNAIDYNNRAVDVVGAGLEGPGLDGGESMGAETNVASGYATPYIAVRMVFPFGDQLKNILKARGEQPGAQSSDLLKFHDFVIERQRTTAGTTDEWTEWEEFDLKPTLDLMDVVAGYENDFVAPQSVDDVITMPLPVPKYGYWGPNGDHATHPRVEKLTDIQRDVVAMQNQQLAKISSRIQQQRAAIPGGEGAMGAPGAGDLERSQPRGWAGKLLDRRGLIDQTSGDADTQRLYQQEMSSALGETFGNDFARGGVPALDARYADYVLFRFVDFDVHPNRLYRYRARLIVQNPNYGEVPERCVSFDVPEGEFRETPWSIPTKPIGIENDFEYYVVATEKSRNQAPPSVLVNVHQWSPDTGTWVEGTRTIDAGERIAGSTKTEVVNLITDQYEEAGEFEFDTSDVLVDVIEIPDIDFRDEMHKANLMLSRGISVEPQTPAIVADDNGELAVLDPLATSSNRSVAMKRMRTIKKGFEHLKASSAAGDPMGMGDALDAGLGIYGAEGSGAGDPNPAESRGKRRRFYKNSLRRQNMQGGGDGAPAAYGADGC